MIKRYWSKEFSFTHWCIGLHWGRLINLDMAKVMKGEKSPSDGFFVEIHLPMFVIQYRHYMQSCLKRIGSKEQKLFLQD